LAIQPPIYKEELSQFQRLYTSSEEIDERRQQENYVDRLDPYIQRVR